MTYSVHQHWDPLKVCLVGQSYSPEFYSFIQNSRVRNVMERIAEETEEDYQKLIKLLKSFNVEILRPSMPTDYRDGCLDINQKIIAPPMTPRDYSAMIGNNFYFKGLGLDQSQWDFIKGADWPDKIPNALSGIPEFVKKELAQRNINNILCFDFYGDVINQISTHCNIVRNQNVNSAMTTRIGKDLYFGTESYKQDPTEILNLRQKQFLDYRCHVVNTGGHNDATFCPVVPGLLVSLFDVPTYAETFPDWEVIYLPGQSWNKVLPFLQLKERNKGKWWVPGEELNTDFTDFVESWLDHWVGYVEETVFDVNMLVIDEKNVVCNNYNEDVFKAFDRYGVTPHVINFRHRYFWDGGLHCITSDLHREGIQKDYFPERG